MLADAQIHELTGGAAIVWERLGLPTDIDDLCNVLSTDTGVSTDEIRTAVDLLVAAGLLEVMTRT